MIELIDVFRIYKKAYVAQILRKDEPALKDIILYTGHPTEEEILVAAKEADPEGWKRDKPSLSLQVCKNILEWRDTWQARTKAVVKAHEMVNIPYIIENGARVSEDKTYQNSVYSTLFIEPKLLGQHEDKGLWIRLKPEWFVMWVSGSNKVDPRIAKLTVKEIAPLRIMGRAT